MLHHNLQVNVGASGPFPAFKPKLTDCVSVAGPDIQAACVSLLALLSHGVCDKWRAFVLSKSLESPDEVVRVAAVRAFPLLLHHLGNSHRNLVGAALLYARTGCAWTPSEGHAWFSFLFRHLAVPGWRTGRSR